jgi:hypothetical protein
MIQEARSEEVDGGREIENRRKALEELEELGVLARGHEDGQRQVEGEDGEEEVEDEDDHIWWGLCGEGRWEPGENVY